MFCRAGTWRVFLCSQSRKNWEYNPGTAVKTGSTIKTQSIFWCVPWRSGLGMPGKEKRFQKKLQVACSASTRANACRYTVWWFKSKMKRGYFRLFVAVSKLHSLFIYFGFESIRRFRHKWRRKRPGLRNCTPKTMHRSKTPLHRVPLMFEMFASVPGFLSEPTIHAPPNSP